LLTSGLARSQDRPLPSDQAVANSTPTKSLTVSGKISSDGRSFVTDLDTEWAVSNPEILKGREGSTVTVRCRIDSDHSRIHVLSVKPAPSEAKYASRLGDAAFRR